MGTRRERRELAADMEIGRRHLWWYGMGRGTVTVLGSVLAGLLAVACWVVWPEATVAAVKTACWTAAALAGVWLFWWWGVRRR